MRQFRALETFFSPEMQSQYVKDLIYTITDGNERLAQQAFTWQEQGKIEFVKAGAKITGVGTVS